MPNLKLDIIYYKTASDFELEFNLSGCCRMRIFKDKVDSQKGLITTLARDVSRSSIILIVTDLFGEDSGVETVAKAVGLGLTVPNKTEYGIKTADDIKIPNGAVPLVTKSGIYGGCIIESGPQSIIIVSNVRSLRHEIMKAYVHNYVFDVAQLAAYNERINQNGQVSMPQRITEINEQPVSVAQDVASSPMEETQAITEEVVETDPPEETVESEETISEESPTEEITNEENILEEPLTPAEEAFEFDNNVSSDEIETVYSNRKPRRKASNIALLVIVILLLIGFGVLAYFFVYMPLTGQDGNFFVKDNFITDFIKEWFMN
ncbi:MAG: hypothetical protein J6Q67_00320 [Clostridia bacterium]|nr:hypothetical protein [Clostridia bacterium]